MSGHNPHGHLSQPNSSWNPLQIPSYIPRQPQLAHMSNERPLVRSPLTWHTPTPPEALYSFISANHKNLELNPLLPSFVRGTAPFGSVDLTIQSARNSTTPSPRNLTSPPPEFVHNKAIPCNVSQTSLPNSISPNPGVIQTTGSVREKYASSNGNNGELPTTGGLFVRDARQINNELVKLANREAMEDVSQPVELVKESHFHATKGQSVPMSPKKSSPTRPPSIPSSTPESPPPESQGILLSKVNSIAEVVNNHVASLLPQKQAVETISTENSQVSSAIPSPSNTTSNEDSVDSSASKTRRKRKPNKTVRVSNDSDESLPSNNEIDTCPPKIPEVVIAPAPPDFENEPTSTKPTVEPVSNGKEAVEPIPQVEAEITPDKVAEPSNSVPDSNESTENAENGPTEKIISLEEDISSKCPQNEPPSVIVDNTANRSNSIEEKLEEAIEKSVVEVVPAAPKEQVNANCLDSPMKRSKRKGDSDDIETIDKIAAMIANSNEAEDEIPVCSVKDNEQTEAQNDKSQAQNISSSSNKINELTEILTAPVSESKPSHETVEKNKENSFEEVETKLEEMFAGIEDERPLCVEPPPPETCEGTISQEGTCDLGLELPLPDKNENISEQKQLSMPQKRTHSNKHDQVPPKKKRKITKKPLSNAKSVKSKTKHAIKSSMPEKNFKEKVKDEPTVDVRYKGPYIQVKPDGSINVINAPITEEDADKQSKVKKSIHNHTNSERSKIRGLHVSTLSTKYDADTTDASWMCVFCKKGPHKMGLGDLFGPYIVTTSCEDFELSQIDPSEDEFISKRMKAEMFQKQANAPPVVPALHATANLFTSSLKKKRKTSDSPNATKSQQQHSTTSKEILFGMSKVSETSYEVWVHEDCAVWAPGVYLVGARILGLEPAVWNSTRYKCSICSYNGAIICCLQRGCSEKAHIPCARTQNWAVDESDFKSYCGCHSASGS